MATSAPEASPAAASRIPEEIRSNGSTTPLSVEPVEGLLAQTPSPLPAADAGRDPSSDQPRRLKLLPTTSALRSLLPAEGTTPSNASGSGGSTESAERMRLGLNAALTESAKEEKALHRPEMVAAAVAATSDAAATGRAAEPGGRRPSESPTARARRDQANPALLDFERARASLEALRSFAEGTNHGMTAQVQILRDRDRGFNVALVLPSSHADFDVFVLKRTRAWVDRRKSAEGDQFMAGLRRTLWQVQATAHFRQKTGDVSAEDVAGLAATTAITGMGKGAMHEAPPGLAQLDPTRLFGAAVTLNFDDTTGKTEVINVARVQYRIEFRLLEMEPEPG